MSAWWPAAPPLRLLAHDSLELAVSRGAAYYGLVRRGLGRKIGGGAAHAFYVGLATGQEAGSARAICLIPHGHEEGTTVDLKNLPFSLTLGQPVQFPLFSTTADRIDRSGEIVEVGDEFRTLPPLHTLLKSDSGQVATIPVHLSATLTELGTLELWCVSQTTRERWRLEFELRSATASTTATITESMPPRFNEVCAVVELIYGRKPKQVDVKEVKQLPRTLEATIGSREYWRLPLLRELWSTLYKGAKERRRSPDHERVFFQLIGYTLRPGFGYPLDEWRCEQTFRLFADRVNAHSELRVWNDFWVMWRRIAGGLSEAAQKDMWAMLKPHLAARVPLVPHKLPGLKGIKPDGLDEMVRVAASLEHIEPGEKVELGNWIMERLSKPKTSAGPWAWALGRLGARLPLYGSGHKTVPPDQATEWVSRLLTQDLQSIDGLPFALMQLTRMTGDRTRDLDDDIRDRTIAALKAIDTPTHWVDMVATIVANEANDESRAFGDTLPIGLRLPH
jgi:hypothetical protein